MMSLVRKCIYTSILFAFCALQLLGQSSQARIAGAITDPDGAAIPGVQIIATNEETGVQTRVTSNEVGRYVLPFLQPGRYSLSATLQGFKRFQSTGINIETAEVREIAITMELGAVTETITVTAAPPLLDSTQATVGQFIDSKTVAEMPLGNRRALELVRLSSNVVFVNYGGLAKPQFAVAGGRAYKSAYMLDGGNIQNLRMASLQVDIDPPVEVIKEFRVVSNGYSAEYGGSGSGLLVSTTKSGTNEIHGSLFEFFRNNKLDAPNFFSPTQGDRKIQPPLRYNLFGGTVGGPVIRNRTHFFAGYEATRRSDGSSQILTVPTELQKSGDFSQTFNNQGAMIPIYDPATARVEGGRTVRDLFPGNIIPTNRLDPVAQALANYWPTANRPAVNRAGAQNFAGNRVQKFTRDNITARVDHVFSDANRFFFRFVFNNDPFKWTSNYPEGFGDPQSPIRNVRWQTSYLFSDTHTLSPNLIMMNQYSYSNRVFEAFSGGLGSSVVQTIGLPVASNEAFPAVRVSGLSNLGSSNHRMQFPIRQHQIISNWTYARNKHLVKFGGEIRKGINVDINRPIISGQYGFSPTGTGQPGIGASGNAFASYMLGFVNSFSQRETDILDRYTYYLAMFVQDDWRVTPTLTLNLGLRWEADTPIMDRNNHMNGFDLTAINPVSGTPGVVRFAGRDGWPTNPYSTDMNNFGPRFGFAWRPMNSENLVIRGGYGIFFEGPSISVNNSSLGFERSAGVNSPDNGVTPSFIFRNGPAGISLGAPELDDSYGAVRVGQSATTNVDFFDRNRRTGYAQHLNLNVQRQLPGNMVLEVSYVGNLSRKLPIANLNINQVHPSLLGPGNAQVRRPFPQFNNVVVASPTFGMNNYHSGSVRMEKRFSGGLSFLGGYTWARAIGDANNVGGDLGDNQQYQNLYNRRADRGPDALDIVHRFSWSSVYELPWGRGRKWLTDGVLSQIAGGWSLGSIVNMQSGGPFGVVMQANTSNSFSSGPLRANILRNGNLPNDQRTVDRWFDTEAFVAPAAYEFGNSGRGILRSDGRINFDFSINKNFPFGESKYVQFRGELFNAFNHPDFAIPNRTLGSPAFGTIGNATDARQIQLGLRVVF